MNRVRPAVVLLAVAALAAPATNASDADFKLKPGATGKICLECHVEFAEKTAKRHVHTPVRAGDCAECHDPHTSSHGMLLEADPSQICAECHGEMVPADAVSEHEMVLEGRCISCHDPHASDYPNALIESGNDLCASCHADVVAVALEADFGHAPAKSDCLGCHDPHASSASDALLKESQPELCLGCHDASQSYFATAHVGYPVEQARCSSCHDPHGSKNAGILRARVHAPVGKRMCKQCHLDASSPDALQTRRSGAELCRACHNEMVNVTLASSRVHGPVVGERSCLTCHDPHASGQSGLLRAPSVELCGDCHQDTIERQERSVTKHEPIESGDCAICHDPHGSDNVLLFQEENLNELCGTCHDWQRHSSHPIGEEVVDPRNPNVTLDCSSCHRSHGTEHEHFTPWDYRSDLCVQCHSGMGK